MGGGRGGRRSHLRGGLGGPAPPPGMYMGTRRGGQGDTSGRVGWGVPLGFTKLFQKIYPQARFELPSRRHCSEKLGAVALLYLIEKKKAMTKVTLFRRESDMFRPTSFLLTQKSISPIQFLRADSGKIVVWAQNP